MIMQAAALQAEWDAESSLRFTLHTNFTSLHAAPVFLSSVHNALLTSYDHDASISVTNHPFPETLKQAGVTQSTGALLAVIFVMIAFSFLPASYALFVVRERETKAKHQQTVSGVSNFAYWTSTWLWDFTSFMLPMVLTLLMLQLFDVEAMIGEAFTAVVLLLICYGASVSTFVYCLSSFFRSPSMAQNSLLALNLLLGLVLMIAAFVMDIIDSTAEVNATLKNVYRIFPPFCLGNGLLSIALRVLLSAFDDTLESGTVLEPMAWSISGANMVFMLCSAIAYFLLLLLLESSFFSRLSCSLMRASTPAASSKDSTAGSEDDDVRQERLRLGSAAESDMSVQPGAGERDVLSIRELRKEWPPSVPGEAPKLAVKSLSLGVPGGQCFGLLGVNGAGKTTTLSILSGEVGATSGNAMVAGSSIKTQLRSVQSKMGYCPQFDAHFDCLTGREHLLLYASIKGIPHSQRNDLVNALMKRLGLTQYADRLASTYSGGNRRKLSVAVALIGRPKIVLMDEPSTGMDPRARRALWDSICSLLQQRKDTSIVLTTHSMEECEALYQNIGIMVDGRLRCLGSAQHLKDRFGAGYELDLSLQPPTAAETSSKLATLPVPVEQSDITEAQVAECLNAVGKPDWVNQITPTGSGSLLHQNLQLNECVSKEDLVWWLLMEERKEALNKFLMQKLGAGNFYQLEAFGGKVCYRLDRSNKITLASLFEMFEANQGALMVENYSLCQTSLEQIFNQFASTQSGI